VNTLIAQGRFNHARFNQGRFNQDHFNSNEGLAGDREMSGRATIKPPASPF
jgi:hypothetical protein